MIKIKPKYIIDGCFGIFAYFITSFIWEYKQEIFDTSHLIIFVFPMDYIVGVIMVVWFVSQVLIISAVVRASIYVYLFKMCFRRGFILFLTGLISAISQWLLVHGTLSHQGILHGWEIHIVNESQYLVFLAFLLFNILLLWVVDELKDENNVKFKKF